MLHPRIAAVWADGTLVGDGLREIDTRILETVDAGKDLCPNHATERLVARVRAAVVDVPRSDPCDNSVPIEGHARVAKRALVPVGAGNVVLRACFDPFHRPPAGLFRCQSGCGRWECRDAPPGIEWRTRETNCCTNNRCAHLSRPSAR